MADGQNKGGRPSKYDPDYHPAAARHLCERLAATDRDLAIAFRIALSTLHEWKCNHPEFYNALTLGKEAADARVERSLYERAVGYSYDAVKIMQNAGEPVIVDYIEHVPPDVNAAKFWLSCRRPDRWKEKQHINHDIDPEAPLAALARELSGTPLRPKED